MMRVQLRFRRPVLVKITRPCKLYIARLLVKKDLQRTRILLLEQGVPQRQNVRVWTPSQYVWLLA